MGVHSSRRFPVPGYNPWLGDCLTIPFIETVVVSEGGVLDYNLRTGRWTEAINPDYPLADETADEYIYQIIYTHEDVGPIACTGLSYTLNSLEYPIQIVFTNETAVVGCLNESGYALSFVPSGSPRGELGVSVGGLVVSGMTQGCIIHA